MIKKSELNSRSTFFGFALFIINKDLIASVFFCVKIGTWKCKVMYTKSLTLTITTLHSTAGGFFFLVFRPYLLVLVRIYRRRRSKVTRCAAQRYVAARQDCPPPDAWIIYPRHTLYLCRWYSKFCHLKLALINIEIHLDDDELDIYARHYKQSIPARL